MKKKSGYGLALVIVLFLADMSLQQESLKEKIVNNISKNSFCKFLSLNVQNQEKSNFIYFISFLTLFQK